MERKTIHWIEIIKLKIICYNYIIGFIFMTAQHEVWERQRNFYWLRPKGNYSAGLMRHLGAVMHCYHQREVHGPVIKWTKGMKEYFMHAVLHWTLQQAALKIALCTATAIEDWCLKPDKIIHTEISLLTAMTPSFVAEIPEILCSQLTRLLTGGPITSNT